MEVNFRSVARAAGPRHTGLWNGPNHHHGISSDEAWSAARVHSVSPWYASNSGAAAATTFPTAVAVQPPRSPHISNLLSTGAEAYWGN